MTAEVDHGTEAKTPKGTLTNFVAITHGITDISAMSGDDGDVIVSAITDYWTLLGLHLTVELATSLRDRLTAAIEVGVVTAADRDDLAIRQARDVAAFTHGITDGLEHYCAVHDLFDCPYAGEHDRRRADEEPS